MGGADPERVLFRSDLVEVGTFRCPIGHPRFPGGEVTSCVAAFPHTTVVIEQDGAPPVLADPNVVVFYNPRQAYARYEVDARGDLCDWIGIAPEALPEAASGLGEEGRPFPFTHGPTRSDALLRQRALVGALLDGKAVDALGVEETVIGLLTGLAGEAAAVVGAKTPAQRATTERLHRDIVEDARAHLARHYAGPLALADVAAAAGASPYHLSRLFRRHTGFTVHGYLTQLRLRAALDLVPDPDLPLARLAVDLGFASHSHFTEAFRRAFGFPPRRMRKISKA